MVARCAQEGLDVCRSALVVSRVPRAAYECAPAASDRSPGSGACRHHQACRRSYAAALLSDGTEGGHADGHDEWNTCPCCGGRMIIIETFEPGCQPRLWPLPSIG